MNNASLTQKSISSKEGYHKCFLKSSRFVLLIFFSVFSTILFAQQTVRGKVTSGDTALIGATVQVKGTTVATQTDANGNFTIKALPTSTLVISSIGYSSQELKVGNKTSLNVVLSPSTTNLNDVVVIGYGTVRRKDLTGAVAAIKGGDIKAQGVSDITKSLQGKMPGVIGKLKMT